MFLSFSTLLTVLHLMPIRILPGSRRVMSICGSGRFIDCFLSTSAGKGKISQSRKETSCCTSPSSKGGIRLGNISLEISYHFRYSSFRDRSMPMDSTIYKHQHRVIKDYQRIGAGVEFELTTLWRHHPISRKSPLFLLT